MTILPGYLLLWFINIVLLTKGQLVVAKENLFFQLASIRP